MNKSRWLWLSLPALLIACRVHPCGESQASAPEHLAQAPLILAGGMICHASGGEEMEMATVMYWGDHMSKLAVEYVVIFSDAGWEQCSSSPSSSPNEENLCFQRADEVVTLSLSQGETPRLATVLDAPSVTVMAFWSP